MAPIHAGYDETPGRLTAEQLAERKELARPTLQERLRQAERAVREASPDR